MEHKQNHSWYTARNFFLKSDGSLKIVFDFILAFGCKQNISVDAKINNEKIWPSPLVENLRFMNIFLHHPTRGCHMAEKLFFQAPCGSSDYKHLLLRCNRKCVGAEFSHSMLPVMCNNCLAIFTCFANERVQSVSLSAASDSGSGRPYLSNPFFHSHNSLVANQEDTYYMTWPDHKCHAWPSVVCSCSHSVEYVNGPHLLNMKIQV